MICERAVWKDVKGTGGGLAEIISLHLSEWTEKNDKNPVRITSASAGLEPDIWWKQIYNVTITSIWSVITYFDCDISYKEMVCKQKYVSSNQ